jgi:replicative DNA helicase
MKQLKDFIPLLQEKLEGPKGVTGVHTGIAKLDELTGGLQESDLVLLAARPGVGKTSFALTVAANAAIDYGHKVAFFSLEYDGVQITQSILCKRAQVDLNRFRNGDLDADEKQRWCAVADSVREAPIFFDYDANLDMAKLACEARQLKSEGKLDLLVVDYLQLMQVGNEEDRAVAIGNISHGLKILAKELKIPVIALAQLSRKVEEKGRDRPQLSDLRESGSIEQDADMVWFVERPFLHTHRDEDKHKAVLIVARNRNGQVQDIPMTFISEYVAFYGEAPSVEYDGW